MCWVDFREYRPKANVTFVENGTKVAALTPKTFVFVPEKSAGDPSVDLVTTVNIPAVVSKVLVFVCVCRYDYSNYRKKALDAIEAYYC